MEQTWKKVLFANKDAGVIDLIIDPNNSRVLYATTWNIRRTPYSLSSGGDGSALWKSTDSGETWTNISDLIKDYLKECGELVELQFRL